MSIRSDGTVRSVVGTAVGVVAVALALSACGDSEAESFVEPSETVAPTTVASPSTTLPVATTTTLPALQLTNNAKISTAGLGPVRIGMTLEEAERVTGVVLVPDEFGDDACRYHVPDRGVTGVWFMVSDGEIVRVDVWEGTIATLSGIGIGSTEAEITGLFGDKIESAPHPYDETGKYLSLIPVDEADADKRVIWETNEAGQVTAFRSGRIPFVEYIEGCA
ncbi:MAG: hypothetical protein ACI8Y4_002186 [Candidatus Poriferisodalaceae bacterium]|jgi:hypothetical protein